MFKDVKSQEEWIEAFNRSFVGHSGGSIIGIKVPHRYPEKIHAYVGVGQIIDDLEQQKISYNFIVDEAEKSGNVKIQNSIEEIGPPPFDSLEEFAKKDEYVSRFGGVYHGKSILQMWAVGLSFITSPEYSLLEGINTLAMKGYKFTMNAMWEEYKNINLTEELHSIRVPIDRSIIFENSAHFPMIEEKEKYQELLINHVLKESQDK